MSREYALRGFAQTDIALSTPSNQPSPKNGEGDGEQQARVAVVFDDREAIREYDREAIREYDREAVNEPDADAGITPLFWAFVRSAATAADDPSTVQALLDAIEALVAAGADLAARTPAGESVMQVARDYTTRVKLRSSDSPS
jgi:hypothetical protein